MKELSLLILVALASVGCRALPSESSLDPGITSGDLEFLPKGKLWDIDENEDGTLVLTFYSSARYFSFDPRQGEEAARATGLLREQRRLDYDYRAELYVTVVDPRRGGHDPAASSSSPAPLPCVVRVALTPDPRQTR